ncbi:hypothetical protein [Bradyrhizobium tunisiense]|uniref:hypothetical protein n=1 Tax=Bradyrhizobium tunisiense TaxID=3278709 RepID=UPI0035DC6569
MNGPVSLPQSQSTSILPSEFEALCPSPQLLPGENIGHYRALQTAIFRGVDPQSATEWLLAIDIAELSWEMQRYRVLRQRLLTTYRQKAIETTLRRLDVSESSSAVRSIAEFHIVQNALDWQLDPTAAGEIEARLQAHGFDQHAISMEAYVQARDVLSLFEALLSGAQLRRLSLLKEFNTFRGNNNAEATRHRSSRKVVLAAHQGT